jgi:hypothetical protein
MDILIFSILTNFVYYCAGYITLSHTKFSDNSIFFTFFIGAVIISSIALLLNFFFPLSQLTNTLTYVLILIIFLLKNKLNFNKDFFIFLIIISFVTFLLIIKSDVNRPDAGLYHLPYISILNENKIFFGLSNIHSRFGHVSIMQYLSAINNNYLFLNNGISIPLASIVSFFYLYFFLEVLSVIKNKERLNTSKIFSLFILIYISFKITRYSGFGNDAVAHLCYFYIISYILYNSLRTVNFNKILLLCVFIFLNKPMLGLVFLIPLTIFLIQKNFSFLEILNHVFSLPILFLGIWLIKNFITSGCAIFPIKTLCIEKLPWTNIQQIEAAQITGEAWSKAWPDRSDRDISMEKFNKGLNWVHAWEKKHMKYILNIIIPYIIVLVLVSIFVKTKTKNHTNSKNNDKDLTTRLWLTMLVSLIGTFSFFLIFPIYRYGYSYIITLISLLFIMTIKHNIKNTMYLFIFKFFLILSVIAFMAKQSQKILVNNKNDKWPNIYTLDPSKIKKITTKKRIKIKDNFYYYYADKGDKLCMYSSSPCTSFVIDKNIKHIKKFTYSILVIN